VHFRHALVLFCIGWLVATAPARAAEVPRDLADALWPPRLDLPVALNASNLGTPDVSAQPSVFALMRGRDRLAWHEYQVAVGVRLTDPIPDVSLRYRNRRMAPWLFNARAYAVRAPRERAGGAHVGRQVGGLEMTLGVEGLESEMLPVASRRRMIRLWGPTVSARYTLGEPSPRGGMRAGVRLAAGAKAWPTAARPDALIAADLRMQVDAALPLPGPCRHRLWGSVRMRAVHGHELPVLRAGGLLGTWQLGPNDGWGPVQARALAEVVRGFEDECWYTPALSTVQAGYRYPITPQLEVEGFALAAHHAPRLEGSRRAAGGAVRWDSRVGRVPVALTYQVAYRWGEARGPLFHLLTASL
jgi:hypothetical protein